MLSGLLAGVTQEVLAHAPRERIQNILCTGCSQEERQCALQSQWRTALCCSFNLCRFVFVDGHKRRQGLLDVLYIEERLAACVALSWLQQMSERWAQIAVNVLQEECVGRRCHLNEDVVSQCLTNRLPFV